MKIATLCSTFNRSLIPHCWSSDILVSATLNVITAIGNVAYFEFDVWDTPIRKGVANNPIIAENGYVKVPDGPGLGIELNEDFLAEYSV